jgi:N-acyl-phosphatidylethanolamine-hydrolysing phospholipase D
MNPHFDPGQAHHTREGFRNTEAFDAKGLADVLRWRREASRNGHPKPPREPIPRVAPDLALLRRFASAAQAGAGAAVTWVGHATVLVQCGGVAVLTDPMFSERASPLSFAGPRRHVPPGVALGDLPRIDVVLVSHNHYDHLDLASLRALARQPGGAPQVIAPLGLKAWLEARGVQRVLELDWWQAHTLVPDAAQPVEVLLLPARHWSGRGLRDRMQSLWGGFAVFFGDRFQLFFAGDTGYSRDFVEVRHRLAHRQRAPGGGFDLALLPIGAYAPRWFMAPQHVDVDEALQIHLDLGAKRSLGVHWGTFTLSDEPLDEPPRLLAELRGARGLGEGDFSVCAIGQSLVLPARG